MFTVRRFFLVCRDYLARMVLPVREYVTSGFYVFYQSRLCAQIWDFL